MREVRFRARVVTRGETRLEYQKKEELLPFLTRIAKILAEPGRSGDEDSGKEVSLVDHLDQYIGLTDNKGAEIYENDYLQVRNIPEPFLVVWNPQGALFRARRVSSAGGYSFGLGLDPVDVLVIGNAHQSGVPDLR